LPAVANHLLHQARLNPELRSSQSTQHTCTCGRYIRGRRFNAQSNRNKVCEVDRKVWESISDLT
jgi:hypothetical protein